MSDSRGARGLFVTCCVALLAAVAWTVLETGGAGARAVAQGAVLLGGRSAPGTHITGPVSKAPKGTFAVAVINISSLMADPNLKGMASGGFPQGMDPHWLASMTLYFMAPAKPGGHPGGGAVGATAPGGAAKAMTWLKQSGTPLTVAGFSAYKVVVKKAQPAMYGMPPRPAQYGYMALPDDSTFVVASNEDDLGALLTANKGGNGGDRLLADLFAKYQGAGISGAVEMTPDMVKQMKGGSAGPSKFDPASLKGAAFKMDMGQQNYTIESMVRFATADAAQKAVADVKSGIAKMQQQVQSNPQAAQMIKPLVDILTKVKMSASGHDATFGVQFTKQEFQGAMQGIMAIVMMHSMAAHAHRGMMGPMPPQGAPAQP